MTDVPSGRNIKLIVSPLIGDGRRILLVKYPNPPGNKHGWWIPAPELAYGQHPDEACSKVIESLGLKDTSSSLVEIESYETNNWHLFFHYRVRTSSTPVPAPEYREARWFDLDGLPEVGAFALGSRARSLIERLAKD